MSQAKQTQARAAKRNARAKAKQTAAAKGRVSPKALQTKKIRKTMAQIGVRNYDFDQVLGNAVRDINKGKTGESSFNSPQEVIEGLKKNTGEVFKLYSYVTFAEALGSKGAIDYKPHADIDNISSSLMDMDNRISILPHLLEKDEDALMTEALDLGTLIQNHSEELYAEVVLLEPFALTIEEAINRLSSEVTEVTDENQRRARVLGAIAYKRLAEIATKEGRIPAQPVSAEEPQTAPVTAEAVAE